MGRGENPPPPADLVEPVYRVTTADGLKWPSPILTFHPLKPGLPSMLLAVDRASLEDLAEQLLFGTEPSEMGVARGGPMEGREFERQPSLVYQCTTWGEEAKLTYTSHGEYDEQGRLIFEWDRKP